VLIMKLVPNVLKSLQDFSQIFLKSEAIFQGIESIFVFMEKG
jgi:hypothetical protein